MAPPEWPKVVRSRFQKRWHLSQGLTHEQKQGPPVEHGVTHCNSSTWEADASRTQGQSALHNKSLSQRKKSGDLFWAKGAECRGVNVVRATFYSTALRQLEKFNVPEVAS